LANSSNQLDVRAWISINQINLHHSKAATALVCKTLCEMQTKNQSSIYLIQEPWVANNKIMGFNCSKMNLFYSNSNSNLAPRTCVVASKGLKLTLLPQFSSRDTTTVIINGANSRQSDVILSSFYLANPSDEDLPGEMFRALNTYSKVKNIPIIMGGDANAHHIIWGSTDTNHRGEILLEYLATTDLILKNRGVEATFVTRNRAEVLDITLVTQSISHLVVNWHVAKEDRLSDHRELRYRLRYADLQPIKIRNPRNTHWVSFRSAIVRGTRALREMCHNLSSREGLDQATEGLTNLLQSSYHTACPERVFKEKSNNWWNVNLQRLRKESRRLLRIYLARKDTPQGPLCHEIWKRSRNKYATEILEAKKNSEQRYFSNIEGAKSTSRVHKILAKDPSQGPGILVKQDGNYTESEEEAAMLLLSTHFPENTRNAIPPQENHRLGGEVVNENDLDFINKIISPRRVEWAIFSSDPFKSPGLDEIHPVLLQKSWDIIGDLIVSIYKASVMLGYIPISWQRVKVVFIPKLGKDDYTSPKSFRPISLSSVLLKGLERLIERYMREELDISGYLHGSQHAFQQGKSTETALHDIVSLAEKTFSDKEFMITTFIDIEGAFDNVSFDAILSSIRNHGYYHLVQRWIASMLISRNITLCTTNTAVTVYATRGTPQGGVLSPLLWLIVVNDLLRRLQGGGFYAIGYADDLSIICRGKFLDTLSDRTQAAVKIVERWCLEVGLRVNPSKSELIIFTKNKKLQGFKNPSLFGSIIEQRDQVKYLGIVLDSKLNWQSHIEYRVKKCLKVFWCCRSAIGRTWGLSPKCVLWLYNAVVKPMLAYGSLVWWPGTNTASARKRMNHLQRVACLCITGALNTTPQLALDTLLGLPRLEDFIESEARKTAFRLRAQLRSTFCPRLSHVDALKHLYYIDRVLEAPADKLVKPSFNFERKFEIIKTENLNDFWQHKRWAQTSYFTDGSVRDQGGGCGFYCETENIALSIPLGRTVTVRQAELVAIYHCATKILEDNVAGNVAIFTDSLGAINGLQGFKVESDLVMNCYNKPQVIAETNPLRVVWIKSHVGIRGHDAADAAAKTAANSFVHGPEPFLPIDYLRVKSSTAKWLKERICLTWQGSFTCEQTKYFVESPCDKLTRDLLRLPKGELRMAIGLLSGHARVNYHLRNLNLRDDPDCRLCGREAETTAHIINRCPRLNQIREAFINWYSYSGIRAPDIFKLLQFFKQACGANHSLVQVFG
jgi:ribonuclease HI